MTKIPFASKIIYVNERVEGQPTYEPRPVPAEVLDHVTITDSRFVDQPTEAKLPLITRILTIMARLQ